MCSGMICNLNKTVSLVSCLYVSLRKHVGLRRGQLLGHGAKKSVLERTPDTASVPLRDESRKVCIMQSH